jgi:hypothetical protein
MATLAELAKAFFMLAKDYIDITDASSKARAEPWYISRTACYIARGKKWPRFVVPA